MWLARKKGYLEMEPQTVWIASSQGVRLKLLTSHMAIIL